MLDHIDVKYVSSRMGSMHQLIIVGWIARSLIIPMLRVQPIIGLVYVIPGIRGILSTTGVCRTIAITQIITQIITQTLLVIVLYPSSGTLVIIIAC